MNVKIVNKSNYDHPEYAKFGDSGMDLRANISELILVKPFERVKVPTGLFIALPFGYEAQIRPKSGRSLNTTLDVKLGTVDSNYRGEIGVIILNASLEDAIINPGEKIAQMVIAKAMTVVWETAQELDSTERGENGFGSTGIY